MIPALFFDALVVAFVTSLSVTVHIFCLGPHSVSSGIYSLHLLEKCGETRNIIR